MISLLRCFEMVRPFAAVSKNRAGSNRPPPPPPPIWKLCSARSFRLLTHRRCKHNRCGTPVQNSSLLGRIEAHHVRKLRLIRVCQPHYPCAARPQPHRPRERWPPEVALCSLTATREDRQRLFAFAALRRAGSIFSAGPIPRSATTPIVYRDVPLLSPPAVAAEPSRQSR